MIALIAYRNQGVDGDSETYESTKAQKAHAKFEIRDTKYEIRDTASLANHVHAHYDVPKTKDGECCGGDVTGLRLIRRSICLHCWARRQL